VGCWGALASAFGWQASDVFGSGGLAWLCAGERSAFARLAGGMQFNFYGDQIEVKFESRVGEPWESWLRLKYAMADYWTGEEVEIDDKIFLATTRPSFGGLRWWFVCPHLNRRVRKLYLPLGGRHFWSRRAYELAYASQREAKYDRALRRARKLHALNLMTQHAQIAERKYCRPHARPFRLRFARVVAVLPPCPLASL
jgi:hypothetical protein